MFSAIKTREEKQEGGKELKKKVAMKEQLRMPIQKKRRRVLRRKLKK